MKLGFASRNELRTSLPKSAQGFLIFGSPKYYNAASFDDHDHVNFHLKTLKTSGLSSDIGRIMILRQIVSVATFGGSCAK
jgi:hypothetical protein